MEVTETHVESSLFRKCFRLFHHHEKERPAENQSRGPESGNSECEAEARGSTSRLAELQSLMYKQIKIRKVKLEPEDGYTTHSFNGLAKPLPVEDIFFSTRALIVLRLVCRGLIVVCASTIISFGIMGFSWWPVILVIALFQWKGIHGIGRAGIPTVQQTLFIHRYPERVWVCQLKLLTIKLLTGLPRRSLRRRCFSESGLLISGGLCIY